MSKVKHRLLLDSITKNGIMYPAIRRHFLKKDMNWEGVWVLEMAEVVIIPFLF